MKFSDFFNKNADRDIAERLKDAAKISMGDATRERMRTHLSEYTKMRPVREAHVAHSHFQLAAFFAHIRPMPVIVLLLIGSMGSGVVSAETTIPGNLLYPIKVHFNEEIQAALTSGPKARAEWALARAERRLEEAVTLTLAGQLNDVRRAEIDTNLDAHIAKAEENDESPASIVGENIEALRFARQNILGGSVALSTETVQETVPTQSGGTTDSRATTMNMIAETPAPSATAKQSEVPTRAKAAPEPTLMAATSLEYDVTPEIRRGHRTAAKVRIEATKRFLVSNKLLNEKARAEAKEMLEVAGETLSSGDKKSSRGEKEDAESEFERALQVATEAGTLLSKEHGDEDGEKQRASEF